ncbi:hypothetical protein [Pedobacter helvus]|uniref:2TM domain-containing protein n=1 Tax=Pedobacter helvus TaxID=2563444 RepID=A0ABW9JH55_9SPHI|nr:hypothetical protein [Pedobacter ureilyticus]
MTQKEKQFVDYWTEKRKTWSWKKHTYQTFFSVALPISILIDLVNYFVIGDTTYTFFSFAHLFTYLLNFLTLAVALILGAGFVNWNYNEGKYWRILRKQNNNLR